MPQQFFSNLSNTTTPLFPMKRILLISLVALIVLACSKTADTTPAPTPTASFTFTLATNGEVDFSNTSQNATAYSWDFGDGTTKVTNASPGHVYAVNGKYNVVLTATGAGGSATSTQVVTVTNAPDPKPTADFTATEVAGVVSFVSTTTYTTSLLWDFGDGTAKSTEVSPKHIYTKNQIFTVVLTAIGKGGTTTVTKSVEVKAAPVVDPKAIYISKITVTGLGYYPTRSGSYLIRVRRADAGGTVELFKSQEVVDLFQVDKRYEFSGGMPLKINAPDRVHSIQLGDSDPVLNILSGSDAYFGGQQSLLTYLRTKGFPAKATIQGDPLSFLIPTFEVEFNYDY